MLWPRRLVGQRVLSSRSVLPEVVLISDKSLFERPSCSSQYCARFSRGSGSWMCLTASSFRPVLSGGSSPGFVLSLSVFTCKFFSLIHAQLSVSLIHNCFIICLVQCKRPVDVLEPRCLFLFRMQFTLLIIKTGMKHACEACVVLYLAQGSYNIGTLDLACLHYIVTMHATSTS